jgi:5-(carboxyamino)imidazole ribonucleotide mutase
MDALLATVMMPSGIPVATVAIDGGKNAALLAAEMIALSDPELADALDAKRAKEAAAVLEKDKGIEERL